MFALIYAGVILAGETVITFATQELGLVIHALTMLTMIVHSAVTELEAQRRFLVVLTIVPLIRVISLTMPLGSFPPIFGYMLVGMPLAAASVMAIRVIRLDTSCLHEGSLLGQLIIGALGLPLGLLGSLIPINIAVPTTSTVSELAILCTGMLFTGFLEELVLRGLLQQTAVDAFGRKGLLYVAFISTVLVIGYRSPINWAFALGTALLFGIMAYRSKSIVGVALAHGFMNILIVVILRGQG